MVLLASSKLTRLPQLRGQLITIAESSNLSDSDLRAYLRIIQQECVMELKKAIDARQAAVSASEEAANARD